MWCPICRGKGKKICYYCGGMREAPRGIPCFRCGGSGIIDCSSCNGTGSIPDKAFSHLHTSKYDDYE